MVANPFASNPPFCSFPEGLYFPSNALFFLILKTQYTISPIKMISAIPPPTAQPIITGVLSGDPSLVDDIAAVYKQLIMEAILAPAQNKI